MSISRGPGWTMDHVRVVRRMDLATRDGVCNRPAGWTSPRICGVQSTHVQECQPVAIMCYHVIIINIVVDHPTGV